MNNSPSKPPHLSEQPNGSTFRSMIYGLLLVGAGLGVGKCVFDKKNTDLQNKPDITDVRERKREGSNISRRLQKDWIPTAGADELINLAQCRLLVLELNPQIISEVEVLKMADKIKKGSLKISADGIIERFCIHDSTDQKKIKDLVAKGFKLLKVEKKSDGSWQMVFKNPVSEHEDGDKWLDLKEKQVCKILTSDEENNLDKEKKRDQAMKKLIEDLKKGNVDNILSQLDTQEMMDDARFKGVENEKLTKELAKAMNKLKEVIKSNKDINEKRKMLCKLIPLLLKFTVLERKMPSQVKDKFKKNMFIDKFEKILEALSQSLDIDDFESCLLYQAGITPEELMESSKQ